jgi:DNA-binding NarL/FixJ family response regulator
MIRVSVVGGDDLELLPEMDGPTGGVDTVVAAPPDVAVIDLEMPDGDGVRTLKDLRERGFTGRVLVLTDGTDGGTVLEALRYGADGCLAKADGLRGVASALRRLDRGERLVDPALEVAAMAQLGRYVTQARESTEAAAALTNRERDVLSLLADGRTVKQIGRVLGISPRTVERHVSNLYRKLDVRSRVQAITRAAALELIELR